MSPRLNSLLLAFTLLCTVPSPGARAAAPGSAPETPPSASASGGGVNQALGWEVRPDGPQGAYLLLSDIHFDPFADPALVPDLVRTPAEGWDAVFAKAMPAALPGYTDDCNWTLWRSARLALRLSGVRYDYAIITGDILAHKFEDKYASSGAGNHSGYADFVRKTLQYVNLTLKAALGGTPLYWTLGNNDSECGDYGIIPGGPLLAGLAKDWDTVASDPGAAADFPVDGYYETSLPGTAGRIVALNTIAWSVHLSLKCAGAAQDPGSRELDWLGARLDKDAAEGLPVVLAMHIPPGLSGLKSQCGLPQEAFLKPAYQARFLALLRRHASTVRLLYAGHTHFDDFKSYREGGVCVAAVHLAPSIGPNHGNNPSYQLGLYRRADGSTLDLATYTLASLTSTAAGAADAWSLEYGFRRSYGLPFDRDGLDAATMAVHAGGQARALYEAFYTGRTPSPAALAPSQWLPYSCAQTCFTPEDFTACRCR